MKIILDNPKQDSFDDNDDKYIESVEYCVLLWVTKVVTLVGYDMYVCTWTVVNDDNYLYHMDDSISKHETWGWQLFLEQFFPKVYMLHIDMGLLEIQN